MSEIQASTRAYLAALTVMTTAVTTATVLQSTLPDGRAPLLVAAFCGLQVLAVLFPLELAPHQRLSLHTSVIFAAVLLFDPAIAVLIAGIGSTIGQALRREPGYQVLFNSCHSMLQAGIAALLLTLFGGTREIIAFDRTEAFIGALVAAVAMYAIDVIGVGVVIRIETGQPLLPMFHEMPAGSLLEDLAQFALGLLTAIAVDTHVWTLPVVVLLAFQMHRVSQRNVAAQRHEQRLRAESERTAHARQEFLLTASHELKTPITAAKMAAQLLDRALIQRRPGFPSDHTSIQRWRDQLVLAIERLEVLVTELLDAARIQQGRVALRPERLDLAELARTVVERFEIATERRSNHLLILDAPEPVEGNWDPSGIEQVLTNLISNALKYSPDGGHVIVRVIQDDDDARLTITDSGIGIAPEIRADLFKPFARGDTRLQGISGTGLGLYITGSVVEQHGGEIVIDSIPGGGTTVIVTLPRNSFPVGGGTKGTDVESSTPVTL